MKALYPHSEVLIFLDNGGTFTITEQGVLDMSLALAEERRKVGALQRLLSEAKLDAMVGDEMVGRLPAQD
jgi:hypothetical protein